MAIGTFTYVADALSRAIGDTVKGSNEALERQAKAEEMNRLLDAQRRANEAFPLEQQTRQAQIANAEQARRESEQRMQHAAELFPYQKSAEATRSALEQRRLLAEITAREEQTLGAAANREQLLPAQVRHIDAQIKHLGTEQTLADARLRQLQLDYDIAAETKDTRIGVIRAELGKAQDEQRERAVRHQLLTHTRDRVVAGEAAIEQLYRTTGGNPSIEALFAVAARYPDVLGANHPAVQAVVAGLRATGQNERIDNFMRGLQYVTSQAEAGTKAMAARVYSPTELALPNAETHAGMSWLSLYQLYEKQRSLERYAKSAGAAGALGYTRPEPLAEMPDTLKRRLFPDPKAGSWVGALTRGLFGGPPTHDEAKYRAFMELLNNEEQHYTFDQALSLVNSGQIPPAATQPTPGRETAEKPPPPRPGAAAPAATQPDDPNAKGHELARPGEDAWWLDAKRRRAAFTHSGVNITDVWNERVYFVLDRATRKAFVVAPQEFDEKKHIRIPVLPTEP